MPKRVLSPQAESHAESSSTASKRARLASAEPSPPLKVKSAKNGKRKDEGLVVNGKRPRKQIQTLDFNEIDELESISDGDLGPSLGKVNGKAGKGVNGKPKGRSCFCHWKSARLMIAAPRRKKTDGGFKSTTAPKGPPGKLLIFNSQSQLNPRYQEIE